MQRQLFCPDPWGTEEGSKCQISFNFNYKVNSKVYILNFVCVLTNERYKTYQTGFSFCSLGHAPGVGRLGAGDAQGVILFFKHGHMEYQKDGDEEQNKMQVHFLS